MTAITVTPSAGLDDEPKLPEELLERALAGPSDPRQNPALLKLIQLMLPHAMALIRAALDETGSRRMKAPTTGQMRELYHAQHVPLPDDDPGEEDPQVRAEIARRTQDAIARATEAALESAAESFHGHGLKEFAETRSLHDLALNLVRITYNRYQKRRRSDSRLSRQADSGRGTGAEGSFLDSRPDGRENPASDAEFREFLAIQQRFADGILEGFSAHNRQIILLSKAGYEPEEIVALINRLGRNRRACTLNTVRHLIETFTVQVDRLHDQEEWDEEDRPDQQDDPNDECDDEPRGPAESDPRSPEESPPG